MRRERASRDSLSLLISGETRGIKQMSSSRRASQSTDGRVRFGGLEGGLEAGEGPPRGKREALAPPSRPRRRRRYCAQNGTVFAHARNTRDAAAARVREGLDCCLLANPKDGQ